MSKINVPLATIPPITGCTLRPFTRNVPGHYGEKLLNFLKNGLKIVIEKETYSIEDKVIKYSITNTSDFEQSIAGDDDCFSLQILVDGEWKRIGTKKEHYWNSLGLILPSGETEQREIDLDEYFNLPLEKGTYRIAVENLASNTIKIS